MVIVKTVWSPKIRQRTLRRLYRLLKRQMLDDETLLDVGWHLYLRARDIRTVSRASSSGEVPCPRCDTPILRKKLDDVRQRSSRGNYPIGWFHCPQCTKRLLWRDCRDALRESPRCFACLGQLRYVHIADEWICECGQRWTSKAYRTSVRARIRLPCPGCAASLHRPSLSPTRRAGSKTMHELACPKCGGAATHRKGDIQCAECGYQRRWRSYRRSLKRRDERLLCNSCGVEFGWQEWRKDAREHQLSTGNMGVVEAYLEKWPKCRRSEEMVSRIDLLVQAIHGRGALGPVFIEGNDRSVRALLDELAG